MSRHTPLYLGAAAFVWYATTTLGHDFVSSVYVRIFNVFGRSVMESGLHVLTLAMVACAAASLHRRRHRLRATRRTLALLGAAVAATILADQTLVSTNIERVHYPQYAVTAVLLRALIGRDDAALALSALLGVLDETLQYVMFPHYTKYLDFNDFILNVCGAALGLSLANIWGMGNVITERTAKKAAIAVLTTWLLFLAATGALLLDGRFASHRLPDMVEEQTVYEVVRRENDALLLVLSFHAAKDLWSDTGHGRRYHILQPSPGFALFIALTLAGCIAYGRGPTNE